MSGPALLIVEDDAPARHALAEYLEHRGYEIHEAATAREAMRQWTPPRRSGPAGPGPADSKASTSSGESAARPHADHHPVRPRRRARQDRRPGSRRGRLPDQTFATAELNARIRAVLRGRRDPMPTPPAACASADRARSCQTRGPRLGRGGPTHAPRVRAAQGHDVEQGPHPDESPAAACRLGPGLCRRERIPPRLRKSASAQAVGRGTDRFAGGLIETEPGIGYRIADLESPPDTPVSARGSRRKRKRSSSLYERSPRSSWVLRFCLGRRRRTQGPRSDGIASSAHLSMAFYLKDKVG